MHIIERQLEFAGRQRPRTTGWETPLSTIQLSVQYAQDTVTTPECEADHSP
jgi:hypothetical protein